MPCYVSRSTVVVAVAEKKCRVIDRGDAPFRCRAREKCETVTRGAPNAYPPFRIYRAAKSPTKIKSRDALLTERRILRANNRPLHPAHTCIDFSCSTHWSVSSVLFIARGRKSFIDAGQKCPSAATRSSRFNVFKIPKKANMMTRSSVSR